MRDHWYYRFERFRYDWRNEVAGALARRLPLRVRYWVLVTAGVDHIQAHEEVPAVPFTDVLRRSHEALL